jgi:transcriptional regulator with XRE-family HTH domain
MPMSLVERKRRDMDLSQNGLAIAAKVARRVVQKAENFEPLWERSYERLAKALGVTVRDLKLDYARNCKDAS